MKRKLTEDPAYRCWDSMIQRCYNPKHVHFSYYGGRRIRVHKEWLGKGGFGRFLEHIGPRPTVGHTIDRINGRRGYRPGNVRWATRLEQAQNTRTTLRIVHRGQTWSGAALARELGICASLLRYRIQHYGLDAALKLSRKAA